MTESLNTNFGWNLFFLLLPDRAQETEETLNLNKIFKFKIENIEDFLYSYQIPNDDSGASFGILSNSFLSFEKE